MSNLHRTAYKQALAWYLDHGVDEALLDAPQDRARAATEILAGMRDQSQKELAQETAASPDRKVANPNPANPNVSNAAIPLGQSDARNEAVKLAKSCESLDDLREAIAGFEGVALKKTATNMVFADGNPKAPVMLIGEAPGADEDRQGQPFAGASGQLLDRILACVGMDRAHDEPLQSIYISNVLNWRPPGNRTPAQGEIAVSLPFIERHIQLVAPKVLILCGGVAAKTLLGRGESVSKLRRSWHEYRPQTAELAQGAEAIPAIVTYHPAYLLQTPLQKKAVWSDMLQLQDKRAALGIIPDIEA